MVKIFIDLEMNPIKRERLTSGGYLNNEIIEIGAVMLDENDNEISSFDEYVRPVKNEYIADRIARLTGITTRTVARAATLPEVIEQFIRWSGEDYQVYSWSDSDIQQITKETEAKGLSCERLKNLVDPSNWIDYQIQYMNLFGYERLMSLRDAISIAGLEFQGRAHGALADARNTAHLYRECKNGKLTSLLEEIKTGHEEFTVSLGSLFDFNKLAG